METPMRELLEWHRKSMRSYSETNKMIEAYLEKEKDEIIDFAYGCVQHISREDIEEHYYKTYNQNK